MENAPDSAFSNQDLRRFGMEVKMKNMTLERLAEACGGKLVFDGALPEQEAAGVVIDSRKVEKDFLFLAVKGERTDGHRYIPDVFAKGALGVVCEQLPEHPAGPCILVEDSLEALKRIGEYYRLQLPVKVVGITGSVGKTSTKECVASVLAQKYRVHKTQGNYNNEIGVPLTILAMPEDTQVAVLEMGINHFGEMHNLSRIARPDICVMTNIGQCHLEYLGSREGILKAKSEIFDYMNENGSVCVNADDDLLGALGEIKGKRPVRFGIRAGKEADLYADSIQSKGLLGSEAMLHGHGWEAAVRIPLPGEHMVYNALAAAAVGELLGLSKEQIAEGIARVEGVGGRSHILQLEDKVLIDDCYNANPVSTEAALDLLMQGDGRRVAILGDMFELGAEEKKLHEQVGRYAVEHGTDCLICVGALCASMYEGALAAQKEAGADSCKLYHFPDRQSLLTEIDGLLEAGDTVLIKASHSMGFEKVVEYLSSKK